MIKLTLKELNDAYQALNTAAESITAGKMKYRFARLLKSAKDEIELLGKSLAELAERHGAEMIGGNGFKFDPVKQSEQLKAFNHEADAMMKSETVEIWGAPEFFSFDELEKAADPKKPISAATLAELLFLISDKEPAETV
jgi:hypothetical protein